MPGLETNKSHNQTSFSYDKTPLEPVLAAHGGAENLPKEVKLCPKVQLELGQVALMRNVRLAVSYFRSAAKQGLAEAQFCLGLAYEEGVGVSSNLLIAAYWYNLAAKQKFPEAQNSLGMLFEHGKGIVKDEAKAAKLYLRAAKQGLVAGKYNFARILEQGRVVIKYGASTAPLSSAEKLSLAAEYFCDLAELGVVNAQFRTALLLLKGKGFVQDKALGRWWLQLAAEHHHPEAIALLAKLSVEDSTATSQAIEPYKHQHVEIKINRQHFFTAAPSQLANLQGSHNSNSHLAIVPYDGRGIEEKLGLSRAAPRL